jgi:hypothetical protein
MASDIPIISTAAGQCSACGGLLFRNVFHICAGNYSLHQDAISQEVLSQLLATSYVPAPPSNDAGISTEPPVLLVSNSRTHCDACLEPLDPNVMHICAGNK